MSGPDFSKIDTTLYRNNWVAVVRGRVIGVGRSFAQAYRAAKQIRPKDTPQIYFIDAGGHPKAAGTETMMLNFKPENWLKTHALFRKTVDILRARQTEAYLVGGAVRDFLLGRENIIDLDYVIPGDGLAVARHVADILGAAFYPLDAERGTGRVVCHATETDSPSRFYLDFASFRGEDLGTDLLDRDFTVNAIALNLDKTLQLVDPAKGGDDLKTGQIRAVSRSSFRRDPVRVLRAVRQAIDYGFSVENETAQLVRQAAGMLPLISPERQRDELLKLLNTPTPGTAIQMLHQLEVLPHILPEVAAMVSVTQSPPHHLDVFDHTTAAMDIWAEMSRNNWPDVPEPLATRGSEYLKEKLAGELSPAKLMPLALLLHDTGKPLTRTEEEAGASEKRVRFIGHEKESAPIARSVAGRLRLSRQAGDFVETVVQNHMRPLLLSKEKKISRRAVYRFFRDTAGPGFQAGVAVALHALADHRAMFPPGQGHAEEQALLRSIACLITAYFEKRDQVVAPPPLLTGRDLIDDLGVRPGKLVGQLLSRLKEAQAAGQVLDRTGALAFVQSDLDFIRVKDNPLPAQE